MYKTCSTCMILWYVKISVSSFSLDWSRDLTAQTNPVILQKWLSFLYTPKHKNGLMQLKTTLLHKLLSRKVIINLSDVWTKRPNVQRKIWQELFFILIYRIRMRRSKYLFFDVCNEWQVRGESRSTSSFISTRSNRQISSRGIEGNVDKAESKSEAEQRVRAGGRQRGLPVNRRGQRGRQQTIRRGSQQSR